MIFISYRRSDTLKVHRNLHELVAAFVPDPFGYRRRLADLWVAHDEEGPDAPDFDDLALHLGVAAGYCVLSGTAAADLPTRLPPESSVAACRHLRLLLSEWIPDVASLKADFPTAKSPSEADQLAYRWVAIRTDVWAMMEAIRLTEADLQDRGDPAAASVSSAFDSVSESLDLFDAALEECKSILATQCQTARVRSLRESLRPEYRKPLPWWLDPDSFQQLTPDLAHIR